jgi:hypothetical protein
MPSGGHTIYYAHCLIQEGHDSQIADHMGLLKTSECIKEHYWWPKMDAEIEYHIRCCQVCQASSQKGVLSPAPQFPLVEVWQPNEWVHINLYGPVQTGGDQVVRVHDDRHVHEDCAPESSSR